MNNGIKGTVVNPDTIYGKSAYEIAVMHGFDGTEEEWIDFVSTEADRAEKAANEATKKATEEVTRLVGELGIVQTAGDSETAVMSQKAVTDEIGKIHELYNTDILKYARLEANKWVTSSHELAPSGSWNMYVINADILLGISKLAVYSTYTIQYAVAFYSSETISADTFISGLKFYDTSAKNTFEDISIPEGAVIAVILNRKASGTDIEMIGVFKVNHIEEKERLNKVEDDLSKISATEQTVDLMEDNEYKNGVYGYYIANGNILTCSLNWGSWLITDIALYSEYVFNCWTGGFPSIAFYSSTVPTDDTFISSITHTVAGVFAELKISKSDIPEGTKSILFCSRTATGEGTTLHATITTVERLDVIENSLNKLNQESKGRGNIKAIFSTIPNSNDFAVIKDEIWFAQNIYKDGVATEETNIHRYRIVDDSLIKIGDIHSDFGHWNVVDYNEDNDCLVFGNAANLTTTEGNFFSVVKNPLALGSEATLATCGIKYPVDIGYKVQAVWGDSNWGKNNIVYLMSNNAKTITKVMLLRDENGEFKVNSETGYGEYIVLETKELDIDIGVGGADFWGDTLYIGIGVRYRVAMMSMTDYSLKEIEKHYYYDDGTEYSGSTQGIHVDSKYIWVFSNVGGQTENHLVQYYR